MPLETLYAHWNPAFRPDSEKESLVRLPSTSSVLSELNQSSEFSERNAITTQESTKTTQASGENSTDEGGSKENTFSTEGIQAQVPFDFSTHEVNGRSEAEFQSVHKEISKVSFFEVCKVELYTEIFYSKRSPSRHDSSLSFARTISEEVTWTDDEVDPEWSSQRTDNETFDYTLPSEQMNSPPQHAVHEYVREQLPYSEIARSIDQIEPRAESFLQERDFTTIDSNSKVSGKIRQHNDSHVSLLANCSLHGYEQAQLPDEQKLSNSFPLIDEQNHGEFGFPIQANGKDLLHQEQIFDSQSKTLAIGSSYHEANRLTEATTENTSQETEQAYPATANIYRHSSNLKGSENEIAASKNFTSLENSEDITKESTNDDLAARWEAALADDMADDGFLDDDGFLSDDDELNVEMTPEKGIDPAALFGSDNEDFLQGTEDNFAVQEKNPHIPVQGTNSNQMTSLPSNKNQSNLPVMNVGTGNIYVPTTKAVVEDQSVLAPQPVANLSPPKARRPDMPQAKSFVNMSKGGYSSPYDLPVDIVPKKRVTGSQINHVTPPLNTTPSRSSSLLNQSSLVAKAPLSGNIPQQIPNGQTQSAKIIQSSQSPQSGFFEDLPPSKPKFTSRHSNTYSSNLKNLNHQEISHPRQGNVVFDQYGPPLQNSQPFQRSNSQPVVPLHIASQAAPPQNFSQASCSPLPQPGPRQYSPVFAPPLTSATLRSHQPRTSSPLTYQGVNQDDHSSAYHRSTNFDQLKSTSAYKSTIRQHSMTSQIDQNEQSSPPRAQIPSLSMTHNFPNKSPQTNIQTPCSIPPKVLNSPLKRSFSSIPSQNHTDGTPLTFVPPQRSRTQSPGSAYPTRPYNPVIKDSFQRPASVEPSFSLPNPSSDYQSHYIGASGVADKGPCEPIQTTFVSPTDGRELDPLQRWKGSPIFTWGVGGAIATSFPKDVPRYGMNQSTPMIFRVPGEIKIKSIKNIDPLSPCLAKFPGPLRGKSKKKEVVAWLTSGIEQLETQINTSRYLFNSSHEEKRVEERILLWKILRIFIEHDGILEGAPAIEKTVRMVLSPDLDEEKVADAPLYATGAELSGISQSTTSSSQPETIDPASVGNLKKYLLLGQREKAVWEAVDKRLWAHAILISNTVSQELYKQVAQEFVQKEVKAIGENTQSLAALYEIFAGNFEESIDELVPPSARAGLQMVSTSSGAGPSKDGLTGLDGWRETLSLVISNRSTEDTRALTALGKLLSGYGRVEAAHICFLFARNLAVFSGIDDPLSTIVLVGSDHSRLPYDFDRELEPVLLSEVFEYGMSLSNPASIVASSPHLSVYKLQHAKVLAEYGVRDKAIQYCETISASITSQTRRSPYHHNLLVSELDDLSQRLKQSPRDDSSSWISKPSIDKAKGSVWATFNKFVSGEDAEAPEVISNIGDAIDTGTGPFSRIAAGTPILNQVSSSTDIPSFYQSNSGMNGQSSTIVQTTSSRYAPSDIHSTGIQEQLSYSPYGSQTFQSSEGRISNEFKPYEPHQNSQTTKNNYYPSPIASNHELPTQIDLSTQAIDFEPQSYVKTTTNYEPESPVEALPTEKLLTLDPNDLPAPEPQEDGKEKTRAEKDREADEAFRRAAEADAKKPQEPTPVKRGWGLTSWFGGGAKKEQAAANKPIRAKLGEASSFVYDPELKRWINKKDNQGQAEKKSSMPPPPKGLGPPRPRNSSALTPAPSSTPTTAVDPVAVNTPLVMARTASNSSILPPSRPSTSMSNASSIDDLLGPPTIGRKVGARAKKKGRGYVDVMGDKAS
ncbi:COPII coat assembly protein [Podosphaera aphanis]|nr:COPII coat assembly protein [Podosphaera aphanis]